MKNSNSDSVPDVLIPLCFKFTIFSQLIKVSNARFQGFLFFLKAAMETYSLMNDIFLWGKMIVEFLGNFGVILLVVVRKRE